MLSPFIYLYQRFIMEEILKELKGSVVEKVEFDVDCPTLDKDHFVDYAYVVLTFKDGRKCYLYHNQDCCEHVFLEDTVGEWKDIIGQPLTKIEERVNYDDDAPEHGIWTFYHIVSPKGVVDLRFYGSSNGYYAVDVNTLVV